VSELFKALTARDVMVRLLLGVALAGLALAAWMSGSGSASAAVRADALPYTDPASVGSLTLCSKDGAPLTSGSITDRPFVWRAVASTAAPEPYGQPGRTATLFAFQPRQGVQPGEWSGDMLTASAKYSNADHPMAQATGVDIALSDYLDGYPPQWNGLVQLRVYLGAPNVPALTTSYSSADIRVTGDTWQLVQGGSSAADCTSGNAISLEALLPAATVKKLAKSGSHASPDAAGNPQQAGASSHATNGAVAAPAEKPAATTATTGSPGPRWWLPVGVAAVVLVALLILLAARGSRPATRGRHA
jgi:hypothetical protein